MTERTASSVFSPITCVPAMNVSLLTASRVRRENPAVVVGDAGRPHHLEVGLHDGVGRRPEHAELAPPAKNVSHRRQLLLRFTPAILLCLGGNGKCVLDAE